MRIKDIANKKIELNTHTIGNHIEATDDELKRRVIIGADDEILKKPVFIASKFTSDTMATKAIIAGLRARLDEIEYWQKYECGLKGYKRKKLSIGFSTDIGYGFARHTFLSNKYPMSCIEIWLEDKSTDKEYGVFEIVTAFPVPSPEVSAQIERDRDKYFEAKRNKYARGNSSDKKN